MTICIVSGHSCDCQPDDGTPCQYRSAAPVQAALWRHINSQAAEIERLTAPAPICLACGSDCNERDELVKAEREIERLTNDAKRYRWLRSAREEQAPDGTLRDVFDQDGALLWHEELDAAVDAALAADSKTEFKGGV